MQNENKNKQKPKATSKIATEEKLNSVEKNERESSPEDDEIIFVPNNPRTWSAKHIETWVKWASKKFNLSPQLDCSRWENRSKREMNSLMSQNFQQIPEGCRRASEVFQSGFLHRVRLV
jgi:Sterile alpha motif (SAM)/Pointed domain